MGEKAPKSAIKYYSKIVPLAYKQGIFSLRGFLKKIAIEIRGIKKPTPREPYNKAGMAIWAHKSTALACENLMLSLRAFGYDSCPMEGIEHDAYDNILSLKDLGLSTVFACPVGYRSEADTTQFQKKVRQPLSRFKVVL